MDLLTHQQFLDCETFANQYMKSQKEGRGGG
jgi:hypothetical protein